MDNLLKEAIADAKAVRETALENAKMALEEAFTPKLQSMLSNKIQMEMDDEDKVDEAEHEDEKMDEAEHEDEMEERAKMARDGDELEERGDEEMDEAEHDDEEVKEEEEDEMDESKIIEIDGVKYAPVVSEEEDEEMEEEMDDEKMEEEDEEDLDLEAVIKELEAEINEEDEEELDENDVSSDIGKADNKVNAKANDSTDIGKDGKAKLSEGPDDEEEKSLDEDIDLDEVLKALSEEEDEEEKVDEVSQLRSDLDEHRSVIEELRGKLNEVNLLNAKLLFTNKLFRKYGLNNEQKMKVVEQFDRASNLREIKLVYSTLGENFGARKNEINESKGAASKPVASTKSEKKVISEGSDLRARFKKLANLV